MSSPSLIAATFQQIRHAVHPSLPATLPDVDWNAGLVTMLPEMDEEHAPRYAMSCHICSVVSCVLLCHVLVSVSMSLVFLVMRVYEYMT